MSASPTFSVVIPTHNRSAKLGRAIRSVLAQSDGDFEIVVADDASTDDTGDVVAAMTDPRIRYVRRAENGGNGAARNLGVRTARGRFVSFLDDDDEYVDSFLAETRAVIEPAPETVGFCWTGIQIVEEGKRTRVLREEIWQPTFASPRAAYLGFLQSRRIGTGCGVTVRRSCFDAVGWFDETLRRSVDTEFFLRLVRAYEFRVVPKVLMRIYWHGVGAGAQVRSHPEWAADAYDAIIERHRDALAQDPDASAALRYKSAWQHYHAGNRARARARIVETVRLKPSYWRAYVTALAFETIGQRARTMHVKASLARRRVRKLLSGSRGG